MRGHPFSSYAVVMDVFHLFEHLKADDMTEIVKAIHAINSFGWLPISETLTKDFFASTMNEYGMTFDVGRDYQT